MQCSANSGFLALPKALTWVIPKEEAGISLSSLLFFPPLCLVYPSIDFGNGPQEMINMS